MIKRHILQKKTYASWCEFHPLVKASILTCHAWPVSWNQLSHRTPLVTHRTLTIDWEVFHSHCFRNGITVPLLIASTACYPKLIWLMRCYLEYHHRSSLFLVNTFSSFVHFPWQSVRDEKSSLTKNSDFTKTEVLHRAVGNMSIVLHGHLRMFSVARQDYGSANSHLVHRWKPHDQLRSAEWSTAHPEIKVGRDLDPFCSQPKRHECKFLHIAHLDPNFCQLGSICSPNFGSDLIALITCICGAMMYLFA